MKRSRAAFWIATWFGCGLVKKGPGTAGSAAAVGLAWIAHEVWGAAQLSMLTAALIATAAGVWASARVAAELSVKDPQLVVIDEVAGQWLTLAGAVAYNWRSF